VSARHLEAAVNAAELKRRFDQTFADPPSSDAGPTIDFLAVGIGGDPWAIRLSEVAGLFSDRPVTLLPGSLTGLAGVIGLRGAVVPVYDLRVLLGYSGGALPRWLLMAANTPVALAFDRFDGHVRVARTAVAAESEGPGAAAQSPISREVVHAGGFARPIIRLASVLDGIAMRAQQHAGPKE
jgi:chemotaxis signal transduction protein